MRSIRSVFRQTFLALRTRNFKLFFIGQTISNTGNWLTNVALTLLVLHITHSGFAVGILAACSFGPMLLLTIWAGAKADRSNKRHLLFVTQSLEMVESFALGILAFMHQPPLAALYAVATFGGICLAFDNPLRRSFVAEMVPQSDVPNAVVLYSTVINVARIIGPAIAGLLIVSVGYGWCFVVDGLSYVAVITCLWMMRPEELRHRAPKTREKGEIRAGFRYVLAMPVLWITFAMLAVIGSLAYNFGVTLPLLVTGSLHGTTKSYTFLSSVFGFGALTASLVVAHRSLVQMRHVIIGAIALGTTMLVLSLAPSVAVAAPIFFVMGLSSILYMTATTTIVQVETDPVMHGRVLAVQSVLLVGLSPIAGPGIGWLADQVGARAPILLGGIACLIAGALGYLVSRRSEHYDRTQGATISGGRTR